MSKKIELTDDMLDSVSGGQITYSWDGTSGTIGIDGNQPFILVNKDAFIDYYQSVKGTGIKESAVLRYLLAQGYIKKP